MDGIGNTASKPDRARARATCNVLETSDVTIEKKPSCIYIYTHFYSFFTNRIMLYLINISLRKYGLIV